MKKKNKADDINANYTPLKHADRGPMNKNQVEIERKKFINELRKMQRIDEDFMQFMTNEFDRVTDLQQLEYDLGNQMSKQRFKNEVKHILKKGRKISPGMKLFQFEERLPGNSPVGALMRGQNPELLNSRRSMERSPHRYNMSIMTPQKSPRQKDNPTRNRNLIDSLKRISVTAGGDGQHEHIIT